MQSADTSGFIRDDAPHWTIESFIPIQPSSLSEYLISRVGEAQPLAESLRDDFLQIEKLTWDQSGSFHEQFAKLYWKVDPDQDSRQLLQQPKKDACQDELTSDANAQKILTLCEHILSTAGYVQLTQQEIEQCVSVASQWGVPLKVDFERFDQLLVYARGDVIGTKIRRRLRRLYRPEMVDVPIYQRVFLLFRLNQDETSHEILCADSVHLRMFKNIPKQDLDMLLPGARVRITHVDRAKILVPTLGGILLSLRKLVQFLILFAALTLYSTAVLAGLIIATIGYVVKSFLSYFQTKNRYLLNLTRHLYFQKLDTNAGAGFRLIHQADRQTINEAMLVYFAVRTSEQPLSERKLRRRCERLVREAIGVEIDFKIGPATKRLSDAGWMERTTDEGWRLKSDRP